MYLILKMTLLCKYCFNPILQIVEIVAGKLISPHGSTANMQLAELRFIARQSGALCREEV